MPEIDANLAVSPIEKVAVSDLGERFIRARTVYDAVNMLMASPPENNDALTKEVAIIQAAVKKDGFTWPEVILAGLNTSADAWQEELTRVDEVEEFFAEKAPLLRVLEKPCADAE